MDGQPDITIQSLHERLAYLETRLGYSLEDEKPPQPVIPVITPEALPAALASLTGGETLRLDDAAYGDIQIKLPKWASPVTFIGGHFSSLTLLGVPGLTLRGTTVDELVAKHINSTHTSNLTMTGCSLGAAALNYVRGFSLTDNKFSGETDFLLVLAGASDGLVARNDFTGWTEDAIRITQGSERVVVEYNRIHDPSAHIAPGTHSDMIQMFGRNGAGPRDITIRRNVMRAQPRPRTEDQHQTQGFLVNNHTGGGFRNIVIEDNLIDAASVTVAVFDGLVEGCAFRRNTVLPLGRAGKIGQVRFVNSPGCVVEGNLAPLITDASAGTALAATLRDNIMWRRGIDPFVSPSGELSDFLVRSDVSLPQDVGPDPEWIRSIAS